LRATLATAIEDEHIAAIVLSDAQAAHARAQRHVERCGCSLDRFADLDDEITRATAEWLRENSAELREHAELHARTIEREQLRIDYAAAARAAEVLAVELSTARAKSAAAVAAVTKATAAVTNIGRNRLREQLAAIEQRAAAYRQAIDWGDATAIWRPVIERLHADPVDACLDVAVGDAPIPPPPLPTLSYDPGQVVVMNPDGTRETLTMAEHAQRARQRAIAEAGDAASAEAIARQRAARMVG
jgi:hypothetical protein